MVAVVAVVRQMDLPLVAVERVVVGRVPSATQPVRLERPILVVVVVAAASTVEP
jgi:hypothetical protein